MKKRFQQAQDATALLGEPLKPGFWRRFLGDGVRAMSRTRVPAPPEFIESLPRKKLPRFMQGVTPVYRVDREGLVVKLAGKEVSSIQWSEIQPGLTLNSQIRTEFEGYKAMMKQLTLQVRTPSRGVIRRQVPLPKLREPLGISIYQNSWEVGRAALLQMIHHAPGPLLLSPDVFVDLQINPYSWKRARAPSLGLHLYAIAVVISFFPVLQWARPFAPTSLWLVAGLVLYILLAVIVGVGLATLFLPTYFGPSIVFCEREGLFNFPPDVL